MPRAKPKPPAPDKPEHAPPALAVVYRPVSEIREYEHNPRQHTIEQIELIAKSITEYGWTNPILIDAASEIVAGHGRLAAALKLGMDIVPTIQIGHLTPAQKRALVIADNKIAITGTQWDIPLLKLELEELADTGFDLGLTGWSLPELTELFDKDGPQAPDDFESYDEDIETDHKCPKCGYVFSGGTKVPKSDDPDMG